MLCQTEKNIQKEKNTNKTKQWCSEKWLTYWTDLCLCVSELHLILCWQKNAIDFNP